MDETSILFPQEKIIPTNTYYCFTLTLDEKGNRLTQFDSRFDGWGDDECRTEIRVPAEAIPENWIKFWIHQEMPFSVVNDVNDFFQWMLFGGNALVAENCLHLFLSGSMIPSPSIQIGKAGFRSMEDMPSSVLKNNMSKEKKDQIKQSRDQNRCLKCGATPKENKYVDLHLHHIKPFGEGGVTHEDNLITLCQICHRELKPHWDNHLFDVLEKHTGKEDERTEYLQGVKRYHENLKQELNLR